MAAHLDRVDLRAKLKPRRDPYWHRLTQGRFVGFRRISRATPGTWLARFYDGTNYQYRPLGDLAPIPDKDRYDAAKKAAEEWFKHLDRGGSTETTTVKLACVAYAERLRLEKSDAAGDDAEGRFVRLVYEDPIGRVELQKASPRQFAEWKNRVLKRGGTKGSFNRNATALRAALNLAHDRREVASDHAWRKELKPLEGGDERRTLYLDVAARRKLIKKASEEVRPLLIALALVPMRPGELAKLRVKNLDARHRSLDISDGKTGFRLIPLATDALAHFKECAKNKPSDGWLISRKDGQQWDRFAWRDQIQEAAAAAKLPIGTCAYTLRHSAITDLVVGNLDLFTVGKISGTSVAMIEKHYGHLQREHARNALEGLTLQFNPV